MAKKHEIMGWRYLTESSVSTMHRPCCLISERESYILHFIYKASFKAVDLSDEKQSSPPWHDQSYLTCFLRCAVTFALLVYFSTVQCRKLLRLRFINEKESWKSATRLLTGCILENVYFCFRAQAGASMFSRVVFDWTLQWYRDYNRLLDKQ